MSDIISPLTTELKATLEELLPLLHAYGEEHWHAVMSEGLEFIRQDRISRAVWQVGSAYHRDGIDLLPLNPPSQDAAFNCKLKSAIDRAYYLAKRLDWEIEMNFRATDLEEALKELLTLLQVHGEEHWHAWLSEGLNLISKRRTSGIMHLYSAYKGSFGELHLLRQNGHRIAESEEASVNETLAPSSNSLLTINTITRTLGSWPAKTNCTCSKPPLNSLATALMTVNPKIFRSVQLPDIPWKSMEPATWIEQATCGLRISEDPTSDNPNPQETTKQDGADMGPDGA